MNIKDLKNLDKDQILELLGLESEESTPSSILRALGLMGIGAVVGASIALLLAPQTGRELRETVGRHIRTTTDDAVKMARGKVEEAAQATKG
jgi:YtxH-like protein